MRECIYSTGRLLRMPGKLDVTLSLHMAQDPCVGYLAHLFLKEAVVTLVLQAILNLSY